MTHDDLYRAITAREPAISRILGRLRTDDLEIDFLHAFDTLLDESKSRALGDLKGDSRLLARIRSGI